jgi:hypothetical protein
VPGGSRGRNGSCKHPDPSPTSHSRMLSASSKLSPIADHEASDPEPTSSTCDPEDPVNTGAGAGTGTGADHRLGAAETYLDDPQPCEVRDGTPSLPLAHHTC